MVVVKRITLCPRLGASAGAPRGFTRQFERAWCGRKSHLQLDDEVLLPEHVRAEPPDRLVRIRGSGCPRFTRSKRTPASRPLGALRQLGKVSAHGAPELAAAGDARAERGLQVAERELPIELGAGEHETDGVVGELLSRPGGRESG